MALKGLQVGGRSYLAWATRVASRHCGVGRDLGIGLLYSTSAASPREWHCPTDGGHPRLSLPPRSYTATMLGKGQCVLVI